MTQVSLSTEKPNVMKDLLTSPLATVVASVLASFLIAGVFFKLSGPVPISVSQTSVEKQSAFDVVGSATVTAVPDTAKLSLGVTVSGADLSDVQRRANETINAVSAAAKKLGVGENDIKTTMYSINPVYDYRGDSQTIKEYQTDVTVQVEIDDLAMVGRVIDAASGLGANRINGLAFTFQDTTARRLEEEAQKQAIADAKRQASAIAAEAGIQLGRIVNIQVNRSDRPIPVIVSSREGTLTADGGTMVEPGSAEIRVSVTLSYETR